MHWNLTAGASHFARTEPAINDGPMATDDLGRFDNAAALLNDGGRREHSIYHV